MTSPDYRAGPQYRTGRVYLGWQHVLLHPDPGPPPPRPVPPGAEQVDPGWLAAQRREESRLQRPARLAAAGSLAAAVLVLSLGRAHVLAPALAWLGCLALVPGGGMALSGVWRGERALRATIAAETRRVDMAAAVRQRRLFSAQAEHARQFRDWQAHEQAFSRQPRWYPVAVPAEVDRIDVVGGTLPGWSAMLTTVAAPVLATGGEVTVIDLSEGAVARDLVALGTESGARPLVWALPADMARLDLGVGMPAAVLADVLATSASADTATDGAGDQARDQAILERVVGVLGDGPPVAAVAAGLRALAQVGDPHEDITRGLLTGAQFDAITGLFGRGASDRVVIDRALALESRLRHLARLGTGTVPLPHSRLRVIAIDRGGGVPANAVTGAYVTVALTHLLRRLPPGQPWRHTLFLAGAERLRGEVIDRLSDACEVTRTGLVLAYRFVPAHVKQRLGRGNAALAVMRLGNAEDARVTSEQIGTEHRFVLSQFTDTVGHSITGTATASYTSTVGAAGSVSGSASVSQTSGHSRGRSRSRADVAPFAQQTGSGTREVSRSRGTSDSRSLSEQITASTSWGASTASAIGANESLARTVQRSREFLVEAHELQRLPPSAVIVSYASREGRSAVLADANPGILTLPTATLLSPEEVRQSEAGQQETGPGDPGAEGMAASQPGWGRAGPGDPGAEGMAAGQPGWGRAGPGDPGTAWAGDTRAAAGQPGPGAGPGSPGAGRAEGPQADTRGARAARPAARREEASQAAFRERHGAHVPAVAGKTQADQARAAEAAGGGGVPPGPAAQPGPVAQPLSWRRRQDQFPPNLGPPTEPLDWRGRKDRR